MNIVHHQIFSKKKIKIKFLKNQIKMRQNFGTMKFSKIKFLMLKKIDLTCGN